MQSAKSKIQNVNTINKLFSFRERKAFSEKKNIYNMSYELRSTLGKELCQKRIKMVEVSIIIPTKNNGDILEKCLTSIQNLEYGNKTEVIIGGNK